MIALFYAFQDRSQGQAFPRSSLSLSLSDLVLHLSEILVAVGLDFAKYSLTGLHFGTKGSKIVKIVSSFAEIMETN